jgi:FkbM family methyltransferase
MPVCLVLLYWSSHLVRFSMTTFAPSLSLGEIIEVLPTLAAQHARSSSTYEALDQRAKAAVAASGLVRENPETIPLGSFGDIVFPFTRMGAITTLELFGLDELIIFSFYWVNRNRYRRAADIGANLGLHTILMGKCGWDVFAYEPDPEHLKLLRNNLNLNSSTSVQVIDSAVSDKPGTLEFIRVLGNTTSSHLTGAKKDAYGPMERFPVSVESIETIMLAVDFIKMDAEGQEKVVLLGTSAHHWDDTDMMVEVGSEENAAAIYEHLKKIEVRAFAQKLGWKQVQSLDDMPTHYKNGSLFITRKPSMPWA